MAALSCESTVTIARAAADVFPWLLDADKVARWVTGLEVYEPAGGGPVELGTRIHEELVVSGHRLRFEMQVTRLDPPREAEQSFEGSGFRARNHYLVAETGAGSRVTWTIAGETTSFSARMLAPMVQARLQDKLDGDLARLRALLEDEAAAA